MPSLSIFRRNNFQDFSLYLPIFLVLLVIGIVGGRSAGMMLHLDAPDKPALISTQARGNGQHNLIVLIVDRLTIHQPKLEGIWLLITIPENPKLTLVPIFPNSQDELPSTPSYSAAFGMNTANQPSAQFLDLLTEQVLWDHYLITDRNGASSILNNLETASMNVPNMQVSVSTAMNSDAGSTPELTLEQQTQLWQTACSNLTNLSKTGEIETLFNQLSSYFETNLNWDQLPLNSWVTARDEILLECDFPTLNLNAP
jgi:hypothetical protein